MQQQILIQPSVQSAPTPASPPPFDPNPFWSIIALAVLVRAILNRPR